jgi:hypothetical protein
MDSLYDHIGGYRPNDNLSGSSEPAWKGISKKTEDASGTCVGDRRVWRSYLRHYTVTPPPEPRWDLMTVEDVQKFFDDPDFGSLFDILWMINREVLCALWPDEMLSVPTDLLAGRLAELDVEIQGDSIFLDMAERRALPASTGKTINFFQYDTPATDQPSSAGVEKLLREQTRSRLRG